MILEILVIKAIVLKILIATLLVLKIILDACRIDNFEDKPYRIKMMIKRIMKQDKSNGFEDLIFRSDFLEDSTCKLIVL